MNGDRHHRKELTENEEGLVTTSDERSRDFRNNQCLIIVFNQLNDST